MTFLTKLNKIMKKNALIIILLVINSAAFGVIFNTFRNWNDLIDGSPDIVVARCAETPDFILPGVISKPVLNIDGRTQSDIEVLTVLKGDTKHGLAQLVSFHKPYQGELFLVFAQHYIQGTNSLYIATENFRVVPLNHDFRIGDLKGKTLDEQIQLILASRLKDLNAEIARNNEEKARLMQGLKNATTNAPTINEH